MMRLMVGFGEGRKAKMKVQADVTSLVIGD
jgi:hypothetical protein